MASVALIFIFNACFPFSPSVYVLSIDIWTTSDRLIIKAGSKGPESGPKVGSKVGQSNNNTKPAPIGMKFGT